MKKVKAFTLAEILIALTIIGVISTLVLPQLKGNIDSKKWVTQRQALYSRMAQAINVMSGLNGIGIDINNPEMTKNRASYEFISELGKVMKMNNICEYDHMIDCGIQVENGALRQVTDLTSRTITPQVATIDGYMNVNGVSMGDSNANGIKPAAFEAASGESLLVFYNPYCMVDPRKDFPAESYDIYNKVCVNFIYDLNGKKAPNAVGKDIGIITAIYAVDSMVVAPMPIANQLEKTTYANAMLLCPQRYTDYRLPNLEEAIALRYNYKLFNTDIQATKTFWTNSFAPDDYAWAYGGQGSYSAQAKNTANYVWCVKQ